ncbi:MAG: hypothetical protein ACTS8Y_03405, partial [Arsenophonus sp. ER-EMS1-MAG3]
MWTSITYINNNINKIRKIWNNYTIKTVYKTNKHILKNQNEDHLNKILIYEIGCPKTKKKVYMGQTGKSVGEVMAIGRTFQESIQKALRGLEVTTTGFDPKVDLDKS